MRTNISRFPWGRKKTEGSWYRLRNAIPSRWLSTANPQIWHSGNSWNPSVWLSPTDIIILSMILLRIIALILLACLSNTFFIEMEDTATQRSAHVYGVIRLGHYHLDNKPALVIEGIVFVVGCRSLNKWSGRLIFRLMISISCTRLSIICIGLSPRIWSLLCNPIKAWRLWFWPINPKIVYLP